MDSAITMVATPCWMKSSGAGQSVAGSGRACGTRLTPQPIMRIVSIGRVQAGRVVDAAHPPVDVLGDRVHRLRVDDAAPERIHTYSREDQQYGSTVAGLDGRDRAVVVASTTWLQHRAQVTSGLVHVLVRPPRYRHTRRTRHHHEVTVEALLQDEAGTGNVGPERDDDDRAPPALRSQSTQLPSFTFSRRGSGTKQCRSSWGGGAVQRSVSHGSSVPCGLDITTLGAQPCTRRSMPNGYRR